jgi:serine/threonine protein kinase
MIIGKQATVTSARIAVWTADQRDAHSRITTGWLLCWERLHPPHFPFIYRIHKPADHWVVEMEWVEGSIPTEWNEEEGNAILRELKAANIFHRDIRLANLIQRPSGHWCLVDFGWACDYAHPYAAPRRLGAEGRSPDGPNDAYAMSVVKRRFATGTPIIKGVKRL